MILVDVLLILALAVFSVCWMLRRSPMGFRVLLAAALVALVAAGIGVLNDRWQAAAGLAVAAIMLLALLVRWRRNAVPRRKPFISGAGFILLSVAAWALLFWFPISPLPAPSGEYPVGVRTFELSDDSRLGVFHAKPNEPRRLLVRVWYPAAETAGLRQRKYFSEQEARTTARSHGEMMGFPRLFTYLKHVRTHSYEDAPVLRGTGRVPVIFYSHGYTSFLGQHTTLMEELASHGYMVFSVQHTFDSAATVFPDGTVAPVDPGMREEMQAAMAGGPSATQRQAMAATNLDERLEGQLRYRVESIHRKDRVVTRSAAIWLADRIFVHDKLQRGMVPESVADIAAAGDFAAVGEMGMSFGGSVSGALCMVDRRCAAAVNLNGWDLHFLGFDAEVPVPLLMLHSDLGNFYRLVGAPADGELRSYNEFSYETLAAAGLRRDVYRLQLKAAQHSGISDFSLFVRRPLRDPLFGTAPADVLIGAQRSLVLAFFDRHLRGIASDFPQAQMEPYQEWISSLNNSDVRAWWAKKSDTQRASIEDRIDQARRAAEPGNERMNGEDR